MTKKAPLVFDEAPNQQEVQIRDHGGKFRDYLLCEMNDDDLGLYMSLRSARAKKSKANKPEGYRGALAELIHLCLYDTDHKRVSQQVIRSWSVKTQFGLFEAALAMNGLSDSTVSKDDEEEMEKNSEGAGTAGGSGESPNPAAPSPAP